MVLFWICIPLMVLAAALAVGVVFVPSIRESSRRRASDVILGDVPAPRDGARRLAVTVDPHAAGSAHEIVQTRVAQDPALRGRGVSVERTPNDAQLLVTVPDEAPAKDDVVNKLVQVVNDDESFRDVDEIRPREQRPRST